MEVVLQTGRLLAQTDGCAWQTSRKRARFDRIAVLISDMWDRHWSRGATARAAALAPEIDRFAAQCRQEGHIIIHAPSDTMAFYEGHPARRRAIEVQPDALFDASLMEPCPALPVDDHGGGSDTHEPPEEVDRPVWTRQDHRIAIDGARDYLVGDEGARVAAILQRERAELLLYVGVHLNMCIYHTRSFSMLPMRRHGFPVGFVRGLTDAMYDPACPPYVSHAAGTALIADYMEKFICPSVEVERWNGML